MSDCTISIYMPEGVRTLGMRATAKPYREQAEMILDSGGSVSFNLSGIEATQGFLDELIGMLVIKYGKAIISRLSFKSCSENMKGIIKFVVNDRC